MYEYKIVQIARHKEKKTKEIASKKGKVEFEEYFEGEPLDEFYRRAEKTLNDLAKDGWQVINTNYSLPIQGNINHIFSYGYSTSDFNSAEFVVVLQKNK